MPPQRQEIVDLVGEDPAATVSDASAPPCLCTGEHKSRHKVEGRHRATTQLDLSDEDESSTLKGVELSSCLCAAGFAYMATCGPGRHRPNSGAYRCITSAELAHCTCGEWLQRIANCSGCPLAAGRCPDDGIESDDE